MATLLVYTIGPYQPFTKILSSNANQDKTDIQNRLNWAGGTDATTGLGDDNLQSNTASGGGLTRATKLKKTTAYAVIANDSTGAMTDITPVANTAINFDPSGHPQASVLPLLAGGTGSAIVFTQAGDVLQFNGGGQIISSAPPSPPPSRIYAYYRFL